MIKTLEEYLRLSESDVPQERHRALDEFLPEHICYEFVKLYPERKKWLLNNPTVPLSLLEILADDPDWKVRGSVAEHPNISPELCEKLSCDEDECVRRRIIFNLKTPTEIFKKLLDDPVEDCAEAAKEKYEMRLQGIEDKRMTPLELVQSLEAWHAKLEPYYPDPPNKGPIPDIIPLNELKRIWPPEEEKE